MSNLDETLERNRKAEYSRQKFDSVAEIGEIPPIKDLARREACRLDLHRFLRTYFPRTSGKSPLSPAQVAAIERTEVAFLDEAWVGNIMPRGFIKSTMSENSLIWGLAYGHRRYGMFFAGTADLATKGIKSIYSEFVTNLMLREDFPEICYPFLALKGKSQRCASQSYHGKLTGIEWNKDHIVFPTIPNSVSSGAILEAYGLLAPPRGAREKSEEGENVRPDIVVLDDPQTDMSAKSPTQVQSRLGYILQSILMMGGHDCEVSAILNATVIEENDVPDQISNPDKHPEWQCVRIKMVESMPEHLEDMWLTKYANIRRSYDRNDPKGRIKSMYASTDFYKNNQKKMDLGAKVAWENIPLKKHEISGIQHAMNILIDKGERTFWAECQNEPLRPQISSALAINRDLTLSRKNYYPAGAIPDGRSHVVFHIDVHDELLYYSVAAVSQDFTGDVIRYGTWPEQPSPWFTMRAAKRQLRDLYPGKTIEQSIEEGVADLLEYITSNPWTLSDGTPLSISAGLVDSGYKPRSVANAIRRLGLSNVYGSRGIGIGPTEKPMPEYDMSVKRVLRCGPDPRQPRWYFPREYIDGGVLRVHFDANFWKSMLASRLVQQGDDGAWKLFGGNRDDHGPYVEHLMSERPNQITSKGRTVNVWTVVANADNHWWDTLVGCAAAASIAGCQLPFEGQRIALPQPPKLSESPQPPQVPRPTESPTRIKSSPPPRSNRPSTGLGFFVTSRR